MWDQWSVWGKVHRADFCLATLWFQSSSFHLVFHEFIGFSRKVIKKLKFVKVGRNVFIEHTKEKNNPRFSKLVNTQAKNNYGPGVEHEAQPSWLSRVFSAQRWSSMTTHKIGDCTGVKDGGAHMRGAHCLCWIKEQTEWACVNYESVTVFSCIYTHTLSL